jgi:hypothetical protein
MSYYREIRIVTEKPGPTATRMMLYISNCPIAWKSRRHKTVAFSSTEAEYIALSGPSMENIFISEVLKFIEVSISYPIEINVDNMGAIYLTKNSFTITLTKHVNI